MAFKVIQGFLHTLREQSLQVILKTGRGPESVGGRGWQTPTGVLHSPNQTWTWALAFPPHWSGYFPVSSSHPRKSWEWISLARSRWRTVSLSGQLLSWAHGTPSSSLTPNLLQIKNWCWESPLEDPFAYDSGLVISFYCREVEKQIIKTINPCIFILYYNVLKSSCAYFWFYRWANGGWWMGEVVSRSVGTDIQVSLRPGPTCALPAPRSTFLRHQPDTAALWNRWCQSPEADFLNVFVIYMEGTNPFLMSCIPGILWQWDMYLLFHFEGPLVLFRVPAFLQE